MSAEPLDQFTVADSDAKALAGATSDLAHHNDARAQLRREVAGVELRQAMKDLREGVRGMIRVSPLLSVMTAAFIGAAWARRGPRRPAARRCG